MTIDMALEIRPLTGTLGAKLRGVNLDELDDASFQAVAQALWDNQAAPRPHRPGPVPLHPLLAAPRRALLGQTKRQPRPRQLGRHPHPRNAPSPSRRLRSVLTDSQRSSQGAIPCLRRIDQSPTAESRSTPSIEAARDQ